MLRFKEKDIARYGSHTFQTMETSAQKAKSFVERILVILVLVISATKVDGLLEQFSDETSRGVNASVLRRNVDLDTSFGVNCQLLALIDGCTETWIVLSGIFVIGVIL